jgi:hypothetical protein
MLVASQVYRSTAQAADSAAPTDSNRTRTGSAAAPG